MLSSLAGTCWLLQTFVKDLSWDVSLLNVDEILHGNRRNKLTERMKNVIQEFSVVKELGSENLAQPPKHFNKFFLCFNLDFPAK